MILIDDVIKRMAEKAVSDNDRVEEPCELQEPYAGLYVATDSDFLIALGSITVGDRLYFIGPKRTKPEHR